MLLLKTLHGSDTWLRGINLELTWKLPPRELVLIVSEVDNYIAKGEKQSIVQPINKAYGLQQ